MHAWVAALCGIAAVDVTEIEVVGLLTAGRSFDVRVRGSDFDPVNDRVLLRQPSTGCGDDAVIAGRQRSSQLRQPAETASCAASPRRLLSPFFRCTALPS